MQASTIACGRLSIGELCWSDESLNGANRGLDKWQGNIVPKSWLSGNHARPRTRAGRSGPAVGYPSVGYAPQGGFLAQLAAGISHSEITVADAVDEPLFRVHRRGGAAGGHPTICRKSEERINIGCGQTANSGKSCFRRWKCAASCTTMLSQSGTRLG